MKAGPHPALAQGKVRYVGDHVAVVIAETLAQARDAAEMVAVDYEVLPAVVDMASARKAGAAAVHDEAPNNQFYDWELGDKAGTEAAFAKAKHVTKLDIVNNRLIPNAMEPRAAIGDYDSGNRHSHALHDQPEPACGAARPFRLHRHRARAQAARDRAGRRRRLRLEDLHLRRGDGLRLGGAQGRPSGEVDGDRTGGLPVRRARPRPCHPCRNGAGRERQDHRRCASRPWPIWAPISRPSPRRCRPISTRRCCRASTTSRRSTRGGGGLHQHRAGRRLSRRRPPRGDLRGRAPGRDRRARAWRFARRSAAEELHHPVPAPDAGDHGLRRRRLRRLARPRRCRCIDYDGFAPARRRARRQGQAARHRLLRLYRGLRHRAVGGGRLARRRRRPVGIGGSARQSDRHGRGADRLAQPRPGPRDDLRAARRRALRRADRQVSIVHGDTDKVQMGMGTYGSRSGAVGMSAIVKALDKIEAKAKKVAAHVLEASEGDIEFKDGKFTVKGTDKSAGFGDDRAAGLHRAQVQRAGAGAGPEGKRLLGSDQLHLPGGRAHLRTGGRSGHRRGDDRQMDRGRRFRQPHQSDDRRGPGARRHRAGRRPGAAGRRGLRPSERAAFDRQLHGLHACRARTICRPTMSA